MSFNNTYKLLSGVLALVLVSGLSSPAFAQTIPGLAVDVVTLDEHDEFDEVCPNDCKDLALTALYDEQPECLKEFTLACDEELEALIDICLRTADQDLCPVPVAGELLSLDSSALVIGGLASSAVWMIPAIAGIAGAGVYLVKFRTNRD